MKRRDFLATLGGAAGAALTATRCTQGPPPPPPKPVTVGLASLPDGTHTTVMLGGKPVDVIRTGSSVVARSMVCPHTGCLVRWTPADSRYHCACHDGLFDENGAVLGGQANLPLTLLPVSVAGDQVTISPPPRKPAQTKPGARAEGAPETRDSCGAVRG